MGRGVLGVVLVLCLISMTICVLKKEPALSEADVNADVWLKTNWFRWQLTFSPANSQQESPYGVLDFFI